MSVRPDQFVEFFREVYRDPQSGQTFDPFPWQIRLAERVCEPKSQNDKGNGTAPWPDALALPTASGKTTCIDIAVFALACQADLPTSRRTAPRRILFVVDRRVIVDEAYRHAVELARRLHKAAGGILKAVADALRGIAGSDTPLTCHQLRGGMYRDDAWARSPAQPCVIASTVDQIGSRLLFRAYGRSFKSWPVHAGLAGNDSLILLDEAHCANPFLQTAKAIARYRRPPWAHEPPGSPFQVVVLSATPPADCGEVFSAGEQDRNHPVLGPRLSASKPTRLVVATKAKGSAALRELAITLAEQAIELLGEQRQAIAVIVNRVRTACLIDELLAAMANPDAASKLFDSRTIKRLRKALVQKGVEEFDHVLMTGRMRPIDRQDVTDVWLERLNAGRVGARQLDRPVFVTATQCLEVGANLDFDAMVSEAASLDALRQRFGRLNRMGRSIEAAGAIVIRQDQLQAKEPDPIYGEALAATWKQLNEWADDGLVDFGVMAIEARWQELTDETRSRLVPAAPNAPIMLPAHIDCWVQTSPEPEPTPDVSIFLHGPQRGAPEIQVCWRADLQDHSKWPWANDTSDAATEFERNVIDAVSLCPPTTLECLTVPRHLFLRWWIEMAGEVADELTDVESSGAEVEADERRQKRAVSGAARAIAACYAIRETSGPATPLCCPIASAAGTCSGTCRLNRENRSTWPNAAIGKLGARQSCGFGPIGSIAGQRPKAEHAKRSKTPSSSSPTTRMPCLSASNCWNGFTRSPPKMLHRAGYAMRSCTACRRRLDRSCYFTHSVAWSYAAVYEYCRPTAS
ncbi:MAG: type I-U CRISPR-associated helicase/endonuclease Cas3 [Planctomycetes bacterium]|nr:type I-U CRISPR-associated helicase/endonuclease Cas3 [Planctomycetota bacterium]